MHNAKTSGGELSTVHCEKSFIEERHIWSEMQKESDEGEGGAGVSESESQCVPPLTCPLGAVYCQDPA